MGRLWKWFFHNIWGYTVKLKTCEQQWFKTVLRKVHNAILFTIIGNLCFEISDMKHKIHDVSANHKWFKWWNTTSYFVISIIYCCYTAGTSVRQWGQRCSQQFLLCNQYLSTIEKIIVHGRDVINEKELRQSILSYFGHKQNYL